MPKQYHKPELVEYGRIDQLTLGTGGSKPDFILVTSPLNLINTNTNCSDTSVNTTSCLIASGAS